MNFQNYDLTNIKTPVQPEILTELLRETAYDKDISTELVDGFTSGFDLSYRNEVKVKLTSKNLRLTVGSKLELWNKIMKEVKEGRYAGPFKTIPFEDDYIQSPIGLVPKDGGTKTRLIFHLSHPRGTGTSVNACTPQKLTKVKYKDIDQAILLCLQEGPFCQAAKSDLTAAFRQLAIHPRYWRYLVMKAYHPITNICYYFVDKCLPFGVAISCALFQKFSDALAHIMKHKTGKLNVNYLDDFFFVQLLKQQCNDQVRKFFELCELINLPISLEKTVWASTMLVFLGLLIDTVKQRIFIPLDKVDY